MSKGLSPQAKKLIEEYSLNASETDPWSDVYYSNKFKIITRQGIDKISSAAQVEILELTPIFIDAYEVVYKGVYSTPDGRRVTTTASASIDRPQVLENVITKVNHNVMSVVGSIAKRISSGEQVSETEMQLLTALMSGDFLETTKTQTIEVVKKGSVMQRPSYLSEMAEKRCNSRGILKLTGFYDIGFYGEDEADDFGKAVSDRKKAGANQKGSNVKSEDIKV